MKWVLFLMPVIGFTEVYLLENVALRKSATQSGTYQQLPSSYGAAKAVDGDTNPNADAFSCAVVNTKATDTPPRDKEGPAWWRVDLGQEMDVYQVKIYNRDTHRLIQDTWVLVSNQERPDITDVNICNEINGAPLISDVHCNYKNTEFTRGRYVQLWRKPESLFDNILPLCEVEVMSCPAGTWGMNLPDGLPDCVRKCPGSCQNGGSCSISDGSCPSGCADGFWGKSCDQKCHCAGAASCDFITGSCGAAGCEAGWTGNGNCFTEEEKEALKSSNQETSSNTGSVSSQVESSSNTGLVAGMAVLGVLVLVLIVGFVVLAAMMSKVLRRTNNPTTVEETSHQRDQQSYPAVIPPAQYNQGFHNEMDYYEEPLN